MRPGVHIDIVMQIILTREADLCPEYNTLTIVCIGTLLTTAQSNGQQPSGLTTPVATLAT